MIFLKLLSKFIKVLGSSASPAQIAWGFSLGTLLGLTPLLSLHNLGIVFLIIIFNVNVASAMFALAVYSAIAWLLDPLFHTLGFTVLSQISFLQPLWTSLYNIPIAPLTRFNNTVVMGSFLIALFALLPHFFFFKWFVHRYRESWNTKIKKWKIVKALKGSKLIRLYVRIRGMEG